MLTGSEQALGNKESNEDAFQSKEELCLGGKISWWQRTDGKNAGSQRIALREHSGIKKIEMNLDLSISSKALETQSLGVPLLKLLPWLYCYPGVIAALIKQHYKNTWST